MRLSLSLSRRSKLFFFCCPSPQRNIIHHEVACGAVVFFDALDGSDKDPGDTVYFHAGGYCYDCYMIGVP